MELPTDKDLALGWDEIEIGLDNAHIDQLEQVDASKNEKKKTKGLSLMHDVIRIKSTGEKIVVEYNENGVPIDENGHKLQSLIRSCVHHRIPITHASWKTRVLPKNRILEELIYEKKLGQKNNGGYINKDVQQVANEIDEILDKSRNDALTQALGTREYDGREKVLENLVKILMVLGIATIVPLIYLTLKKKVVDEEEVKEEKVIATRPSISKNVVTDSRQMTKEVEVTNEPSNLPIQLKYILIYPERGNG
ncbi:uncharacterized protein E5676_scaffold943G00770 [Cucumis melo var. makuwa]|uniref:Uncharacterized protein n=1 Tax=Cucumis melo var. makuwa TaxID=1194695 RepID=A0A5A7UQX8_CUCMM|nr:uncharacterized protein E6C27_scaffold104G00590 [Cucumis melo var. makuwa]TYK24102.1 uncharacterized protein E5676_scaffold943G00770 [Cucumis melo var. makuwa]